MKELLIIILLLPIANLIIKLPATVIVVVAVINSAINFLNFSCYFKTHSHCLYFIINLHSLLSILSIIIKTATDFIIILYYLLIILVIVRNLTAILEDVFFEFHHLRSYLVCTYY